MISQNYTEHNARTIDQWVRDGWDGGRRSTMKPGRKPNRGIGQSC